MCVERSESVRMDGGSSLRYVFCVRMSKGMKFLETSLRVTFVFCARACRETCACQSDVCV